MERCEAALDTPLGELSLEQLRLLIGQGFGLDLLVPRALTVLDDNPSIGVTFYDGDLLAACLRAPTKFWIEHPDLADAMRRISGRVNSDERLVAEAQRSFHKALAEAG